MTELLFAAGGGSRVVGAVNYSDYPEAAKRIPRIGSNREIDMELLISLKPDLIVAWRHNSSDRQIEMVRQLGIPVFQSDAQTLDAIPDSVERLGQLMGTDAAAKTAAAALRTQLASLRKQYAGRAPVRVFYQVWDKPLYTLSGKHILTDAMHLCGGVNVFDKLAVTAPVVTLESVLQENPEVIIRDGRKELRRRAVVENLRHHDCCEPQQPVHARRPSAQSRGAAHDPGHRHHVRGAGAGTPAAPEMSTFPYRTLMVQGTTSDAGKTHGGRGVVPAADAARREGRAVQAAEHGAQ